jgi:hypothetical protein
VPVDHLSQRLDDRQRVDTRVLQRRPSGISQPKAADHDVQVQVRALQLPQAKPRERDLSRREQAGHQKLVIELDLVYIATR